MPTEPNTLLERLQQFATLSDETQRMELSPAEVADVAERVSGSR